MIDVLNYVKVCEGCQMQGPLFTHRRKPSITLNKIFGIYWIDLAESPPKSKLEKKALIINIEYLTDLPIAVATKN